MRSKSLCHGVTVVELLLVLAVLAVLSMVALPRLLEMRSNQLLAKSASDIVQALQKAKAKTLGSYNASEYGVYFSSNQIIIFKGQNYVPGASENEITAVPSPLAISNVALGGISGTTGELYWKRLTGAPSKSGSITLLGSGTSKIITISPAGSVSSN